MKIDSHVLFLIVIIGIISAGIVGATVMNSDTSMKQEVFDGITVSVPVDSEFVKVGEGVYKDSNYGITINTFQNNASMIDFLKNTKKSKIIPIENQPPQSVAFKKGNTINILVTNGNEGISISSKDGELTSEMANNIIFSNNHKSQKSIGLPFVRPPMNVDQDFNLIMLLVADVDTKIFNTGIFQENLIIVTDDYNEELDQPVDDVELLENLDEESDEYVSDISSEEDLNNVLSDSDSSINNDDNNDQSDSDTVSPDVTSMVDNSPDTASSDVNSMDNGPDTASSDIQTSDSPDTSNEQQELSVSDCENIINNQFLTSHPDLRIDSGYQEVTDGYVFTIVDSTNMAVGKITVNALNGQMELSDELKNL